MNFTIDWNTLLDHMLTLVFTAATPVVLYLAHKLVGKIADKLHLQNLISYNNAIDDVIGKAMQSIEVTAESALKNNNTVLSMEQKLQSIVQLVVDELTHIKLPQPPPAQLVMRVHAKMFDKKG